MQNQLKNFAPSRVCTWHISTPLIFSNGKPKTMTTPRQFEIIFFQQHNALTSYQEAGEGYLYSLFNIITIIVHIKWGADRLASIWEALSIGNTNATQQHHTNQDNQASTAARMLSGTKNSTTPNKRPKDNPLNYVL